MMEKANGSPNGSHQEMTLISPRQASKLSGYCLQHLRRLAKDGTLRSSKRNGGHYRYYLEDIIAFRDAKESPFARMPTPRDARKFMIEARRNDQLNFRCPASLRAAVKQMAHDLRRSESDVIRMAIEDAAAKYEAIPTRKHEAIRTRNTKDSSEIASKPIIDDSAVQRIADAVKAAIVNPNAPPNTPLRNYANTPERDRAKEIANLLDLLLDAFHSDDPPVPKRSGSGRFER